MAIGTPAEQKGYAPDSREKHERENDAAENCSLSAEKPRHDIKPEKPDASPVDSSYDNQNQCDSVEHGRSFLRKLCASRKFSYQKSAFSESLRFPEACAPQNSFCVKLLANVKSLAHRPFRRQCYFARHGLN